MNQETTPEPESPPESKNLEDLDELAQVAARQWITEHGWPSRDKAPAWLTGAFRSVITSTAKAAVDQAITVERARCAEVARAHGSKTIAFAITTGK